MRHFGDHGVRGTDPRLPSEFDSVLDLEGKGMRDGGLGRRLAGRALLQGHGASEYVGLLTGMNVVVLSVAVPRQRRDYTLHIRRLERAEHTLLRELLLQETHLHPPFRPTTFHYAVVADHFWTLTMELVPFSNARGVSVVVRHPGHCFLLD
jgi:hypothetical protein